MDIFMFWEQEKLCVSEAQEFWVVVTSIKT